ncbi:MAG: hypothetical protein EOO05_12285 [Chitinophagaceae bacterium]|nr:MAG: hypothetical protein EOO05_12285 [Chitinophagaceae bacterium]
MTRNFTNLLLACGLFALPVFFTACIQDECISKRTFRLYTPVMKNQAEVRNDVVSSAPRDVIKPGKIYLLGNYILLNDVDRGIHVIDNSDPSSPKNVSWIDIPGNMDMAAKGNMLYVDFYSELLAIDMTDPLNVHVAGYKPDVFPVRYYTSTIASGDEQIVADWIIRDTTINDWCDIDQSGGNPVIFSSNVFSQDISAYNSTGSQSNSGPQGVGGSMARFTVSGNFLYTVSINSLSAIDISNPAEPVSKSVTRLAYGTETIFPFNNELFIGSQTGMYRFDLGNPAQPREIGLFSHVQSCDPVIADEKYAYVTLRSGNSCQGFSNQLDIINLEQANANDPFQLLVTHQMTNPHGLGKDGDLLFICDGPDGLKVFDSKDIYHLRHLKTIPMEAHDVILHNKRALVIAKDGVYQFNYANPANISLLSKVNLQKF